MANSGHSGTNALAVATTLDDLRKKQKAFEALPSVAEVDSVLHLIPDDQPAKIAIVKSFEPLVAPVRIGRSSPVDLERLREALSNVKRRLDVVAAEAGDKLPEDIVALRQKTAAVLKQLTSADRETAEPALSYLQAQLYRDFVSKFYSLQRNLYPRKSTIKDVPAEVKRKFVGANGTFLLQIHPRLDVWEREGAQQFVTELRSVDPAVTGAPVITYEATRLMERGYSPGHAVRVHPRRGADLPDDPPLAGDRARHAAARPGPRVDDRPDARAGAQVQPGQRLGTAADHWHVRRVRPQRRAALHGRPPVRRTAGGAQHGHGGRAQRHLNHSGLRQPDGRCPSRDLRTGAPPHARHRRAGCWPRWSSCPSSFAWSRAKRRPPPPASLARPPPS